MPRVTTRVLLTFVVGRPVVFGNFLWWWRTQFSLNHVNQNYFPCTKETVKGGESVVRAATPSYRLRVLSLKNGENSCTLKCTRILPNLIGNYCPKGGNNAFSKRADNVCEYTYAFLMYSTNKYTWLHH